MITSLIIKLAPLVYTEISKPQVNVSTSNVYKPQAILL